jgi:hypothetical protein
MNNVTRVPRTAHTDVAPDAVDKRGVTAAEAQEVERLVSATVTLSENHRELGLTVDAFELVTGGTRFKNDLSKAGQALFATTYAAVAAGLREAAHAATQQTAAPAFTSRVPEERLAAAKKDIQAVFGSSSTRYQSQVGGEGLTVPGASPQSPDFDIISTHTDHILHFGSFVRSHPAQEGVNGWTRAYLSVQYDGRDFVSQERIHTITSRHLTPNNFVAALRTVLGKE